jgi:23S rRNA (guanosine2251-2'-O)-methyltransferase
VDASLYYILIFPIFKPNVIVHHMKKEEVYVLLCNIRSTHNVGSIFRTADALGVSRIYLSGITPTPLDRFGRQRKDVAKVALGAEKNISWEYVEDGEGLIKDLKKGGFQIIAIEQDKKSVDYKKIKIKRPVLFIVGSEVLGIDKKILSLCHIVAEIPMKGEKESLNVSVAFGVALFRLLNI